MVIDENKKASEIVGRLRVKLADNFEMLDNEQFNIL